MTHFATPPMPPAAAVPMELRPVLTPDQRKEVEKVRDMQVRTNAATLAAQCLAGTAPEPRTVIALARVLELYIAGTPSAIGPEVGL